MKNSCLKFCIVLAFFITQACQGAQGPEGQTMQRNRSNSTSSIGSTTSESSTDEQNSNRLLIINVPSVRSINREQDQNSDAFEQAVKARVAKKNRLQLSKHDITSSVTCCLAAFGFIAGIAIQKICKQE